jgi:probable HAF family extracellular repeat protein
MYVFSAGCGGGGSSGPDIQSPSVPSGVTGTPISLEEAHLSWRASVDQGSGVEGYRIYRDGVEVASTTNTDVTVGGLTPAASYDFTVRAYDSASPSNVSDPSAAVAVRQPPEFDIDAVPITECSHTDVRARQLNENGDVLGADFLYRDRAVTSFSPTFRAVAMNDAGQVSGVRHVTNPVIDPDVYPGSSPHGFLYDGTRTTDIGTIGGNVTEVSGITPDGTVYGRTGDTSPASFSTRAFTYSNGRMSDLGTLGGRAGWATDINRAGTITGFASDASGRARPFVYQAGTMSDLCAELTDECVDSDSSWEMQIAETGQILGLLRFSGGTDLPGWFLYENGTFARIVSTLGGTGLDVRGMDETGTVYGSSQIPGNAANHAFLLRGGVMADVGPSGSSDSTVTGANRTGQYIGSFDGGQRAFVYRDGRTIDLGVLDPENSTRVDDINDSGQIVGLSGFRAFLYTDGKMWDLKDLARLPRNAPLGCPNTRTEINDAGQVLVIGKGCAPSTYEQCSLILLTPLSHTAARFDGARRHSL